MSMVPKCRVTSARLVAEVALLQRGGELPAIVDQRADEGEEAPGAAGCVRTGGRPILVGIGAVGWDGGGRGGHERNMNLSGGSVARNIFQREDIQGMAATPGGLWVMGTAGTMTQNIRWSGHDWSAARPAANAYLTMIVRACTATEHKEQPLGLRACL
jgi:hypothetical protein